MSQENLNPHHQNNASTNGQQTTTTNTTTTTTTNAHQSIGANGTAFSPSSESQSSPFSLNSEQPVLSQTPRVAIVNAQTTSVKLDANTNSPPVAALTANTTNTAISNSSNNNSSSIDSSSSTNNTNNKSTVTPESGDETEEDEEVEHSPGGGRWSKRNQPVAQRDVPGIDKAYLAMDTENGYEVVWNEINLSSGKKFKNTNNINKDESKIDAIFQRLIKLNHPNIVKFHHYWIDKNEKELRRIIFITEYMSSGSLKQFLRKAKKTNQSIKKQTWKRWSIQLLVALHYLHNSEHPIIHDDLSCDTIYIQHNGLIKIGSIAPDIVNNHVKTCVDISKSLKNMHYMAPETREIGYSSTPSEQTNESENNSNSNVSSATSSQTSSSVNSQSIATINLNKTHKTTAVDIYAFGIVALEMFNLEFGGNGDTHPVTPELIKQSIEALDEKQQDFIKKCLENDPKKRPTAKELLFDPLLFEVPSLRLIAAHQYINNQNETRETNTEINSLTRLPDYVIASNKYQEFKYSQLGSFFDANKYLEDVRNGIYPLTAFGLDRQLKKTTVLPLNQSIQQQQQQTHTSSNLAQPQTNNNVSTTNESIKVTESNQTSTLQENSDQELSNNQQVFESLSASSTNQDEKFHQQQQPTNQHLINSHPDNSTASQNNTNNNSASLNVSPYSDSSSNNLSGNTSLNYLSSNSSTSSPSSTSPSQSLSNINLQQQQQQQQQPQQLHYISDPSSSHLNFQIDSNQHFESETVAELNFSGQVNYSNQVSSSNSSSAATPTPQHQQNLIYQQQQQQQQQMHLQHLSNEINMKVLSASSASSSSSSTPPPPNMSKLILSEQLNSCEQPQQHAYLNGYTNANSGTQSPILSTNTANLSNGAVLQNLINKNLHGEITNNSNNNNNTNNNQAMNENINTTNSEKRHAQNMTGDLTLIDKNNFNNYKLTLQITFDDKSARVLTSSISRNDTVVKLVDELISYGLVNELDKNSLYQTLTETWYKFDSLINDQHHHQQQQPISENSYISQNNPATLL